MMSLILSPGPGQATNRRIECRHGDTIKVDIAIIASKDLEVTVGFHVDSDDVQLVSPVTTVPLKPMDGSPFFAGSKTHTMQVLADQSVLEPLEAVGVTGQDRAEAMITLRVTV